MQNKNFQNFVKAKGYYIVLLICAVAVGVTGYFLLTADKPKEPALEVVASVSDSTGKQASSEPTESVGATQDTEVIATNASTPFTLTWPVDGESITAFAADRLAYNATTRDWRTHEGIDLSAVIGQDVFAAADGVVYTIYNDEDYGMTIVLRHTGGFTTHYSNLSEEVAVSVGQEVSAGTLLGTVGATANAETATAPHLHFSLYQNNVPVDPCEYLK